MPSYSKHGKKMIPLSDEDFIKGMENGKFVRRKHKGFVALLYYSAVRKMEALRVRREQFTVKGGELFFDVGKRLKHGKVTPPLNIPLSLPFMDELLWAIEHTHAGARVLPYCEKTGYNIVDRVFAYPHFFRLSRITNFFLEGWTIAQVRSWTGLTLQALESYVGMVDVTKMGRSLGSRKNHAKEALE